MSQLLACGSIEDDGTKTSEKTDPLELSVSCKRLVRYLDTYLVFP